LINLIRHCDEVFSVVLLMADRRQLLIESKLDGIEERLVELIEFLRSRRGEHRRFT